MRHNCLTFALVTYFRTRDLGSELKMSFRYGLIHFYVRYEYDNVIRVVDWIKTPPSPVPRTRLGCFLRNVADIIPFRGEPRISTIRSKYE